MSAFYIYRARVSIAFTEYAQIFSAQVVHIWTQWTMTSESGGDILLLECPRRISESENGGRIYTGRQVGGHIYFLKGKGEHVRKIGIRVSKGEQ
jgi:hypothetical protein